MTTCSVFPITRTPARALPDARMFRISRDGREPIVDVDQVEAVEAAIRSSAAGRYHVDEISADPLPSGHTSRRWGVGIKRPDGVVTLDRDPWPPRTDDTIDRSPWPST